MPNLAKLLNEALVTSDRRRISNRANAQKSTGPKSSLGKRRSSRNALIHGLAIPAGTLESCRRDIEILANSIARATGTDTVNDLCWLAAEAQVEIFRVSQARAAAHSGNNSSEELSSKLLQLDRYYRRAFSKRNLALRVLRT